MGGERLYLLNLELAPYDEVLALQGRLVEAVREDGLEGSLILLEHLPVITLGYHASEANIVAPSELLSRMGVEVRRVERGGDVTYHGPGQLVGYPILNLLTLRQSLRRYIWSLEEVLIRTLRSFGIGAERQESLPGVWVGEAKIAAIGVRVKRWITSHGFALNISPDMSHFALILPCGLSGKGVTSMQELLGKAVDAGLVRRRVAWHFSQVFGVQLIPISRGELEERLTGLGQREWRVATLDRINRAGRSF